MPGMLGGMVADKTELELFVGNTPPGTSEFVLLNFLNAAMAQVISSADTSLRCIKLVLKQDTFNNLLG